MSATLKTAAVSHSHKRRRITPSKGSLGSTSTFLTIDGTSRSSLQKTVPTHGACTSCHRYLSSSSGALVLCARCSAPTCAICSRTCTASIPTTPPTPALTWASSPSTPSYSPRRTALTVHALNVNAGQGAGVKRKKSRDESDENQTQQHTTFAMQKPAELEDVKLGAGCGSIVCKACCFEDPQSDAIACYDCFQH